MTETPSQSLPQTTGRSVSRWKTPMRDALKTPRTHRLFASVGPKTPHRQGQSYSYGGLLNKTWRAHSLSPLFNFKTSKVSLRQYGRSLDLAFSKGVAGIDTDLEGTHSHFEVYHGLSFHADDPDAVRIQVFERQDEVDKVVLTAVLCSVDLEDPGLVVSGVSDSFVFYPLVLVCGNKTRADVLLDWLQRHFDCRSSPIEFTDPDLRWFLALGCHQGGAKPQPVLLQYNLKEASGGGASTIDCKFESSFCKELWDKQQENSNGGELMRENEVVQFVSALEDHLEYVMHVIFTKLTLSEVGTPMCYVARDGKLKILDSGGVYIVLHMICEVITCKYAQGFGFFG